jgi:hypothetical protein
LQDIQVHHAILATCRTVAPAMAVNKTGNIVLKSLINWQIYDSSLGLYDMESLSATLWQPEQRRTLPYIR